MPPGQKDTIGKKGRDPRQSRSRNTTPGMGRSSVPPPESGETAYLELSKRAFRTSDDIVEQHVAPIPSSKELELLLERLQRLVEAVDARGAVCDRGMRVLSKMRRERLEEIEEEKRAADRLKRDAAEEEERSRNKANSKKRKDASRAAEERPLTHGAHGVAPQDGSNLGSTSPNSASRKQKRNNSSRDLDSASSSLSPVQATPGAMDIDDKKDDGDGDSSSDEHQPKPAPAIPHMFTFGDDPSTFPDPTVYAIPLVLPGMSYEETCKIFSVSSFPKSDLSDLIPGFPPDKDFSNAKPTNQVQANTFATYLDPYFRPFNDEDLAFLRERGDRVAPFQLPRRGRKHYTEIWAEEDGIEYTSQNGRDKLPANQPRGNIEDMTDAVAETEQISLGPIASRLLSTLRHEQRATPPEINGLTNGESTTTGENGDLDNILGVTSDEPAPLPPATAMPDSNSEGWKKAIHPKLDALQVDERIKQELRHIGFLPDEPNAPEFDGHFDDELAARLRILQARYKEVAINNIARKLRLTELVKERMAHQEYSTILEDLDGQVQAHYLKRTRTMGKSKKAKRPGGAGGGSHVVAGAAGMAKPALNDQIKTAMDRRKKWTGSIGVVFDEKKPPNSEDPASFIFTPDQMAEHVSKAQEDWIEDADEE